MDAFSLGTTLSLQEILMSASSRAKYLGLYYLEENDFSSQIKTYLDITAKNDYRRLLWVIERATNDLAQRIQDEEDEIVRAKQFTGQGDRLTRAEARLNLLTEDFTFLYSLLQVVRTKSIESSVEDLVGSFRGKP